MARPRSFDREAALEQALTAFWERGFEQTSINDLTAAMGIAPPSLYAAFGDKRRLFEEAVAHYQEGPGMIVQRGLEEATARASIERMLHEAAHEYARDGRPRGCLIVSEPSLGELRAVSRAAIRARLQAGADAGELPPGTDLDALAGYVGVVIGGAVGARPRRRERGRAARDRRPGDGGVADCRRLSRAGGRRRYASATATSATPGSEKLPSACSYGAAFSSSRARRSFNWASFSPLTRSASGLSIATASLK